MQPVAAVVLPGLEDGQKVVVAGQSRLSNGTRVAVAGDDAGKPAAQASAKSGS